MSYDTENNAHQGQVKNEYQPTMVESLNARLAASEAFQERMTSVVSQLTEELSTMRSNLALSLAFVVQNSGKRDEFLAKLLTAESLPVDRELSQGFANRIDDLEDADAVELDEVFSDLLDESEASAELKLDAIQLLQQLMTIIVVSAENETAIDSESDTVVRVMAKAFALIGKQMFNADVSRVHHDLIRRFDALTADNEEKAELESADSDN